MMKNYLAIDSGGTKVLAVLYDENFCIKKVARVGSFRENTTPREMIIRNRDDFFVGLELNDGTEIEYITGTVDHVLFEQLNRKCIIGDTMHFGELELGLGAAGIFGDALLALSGTGATLFSKYNGKVDFAGGYGASVSDAGSGYWMGREALGAAIAYDEERGEETLLRDMITAHFGRTSLRNSLFSIYSRSDISPAAAVASCAPIVSEAAYLGDRAAHDIIIKTGRILGEQLVYLIKKHDIPESVPVTISGSVWRGHHDLFGEFCRTVGGHGRTREIIVPEFEPVVGAIIHHYKNVNGGFGADDLAFFRKEYAKFGFSIKRK